MATETKNNYNSQHEIANDLLNIGAVQLNMNSPFTWVSGIKSPIYCDNRKVSSNVKVRQNVIKAFVNVIKHNFSEVEIIAGVATGGIPFGALIADKMNLPFIYVRQAPKEHGLMKQVEGYYKKGQKVVVIEDHISTGGSSLKAINGLRNVSLEILGLISIMTYDFKSAIELFKNENINHISLCSLDIIAEVARENNKITDEEVKSLIHFRDNPKNWKSL